LANRVHTIRFFPPIAAGAVVNATFNVNNYGREMKVKSITHDLLIYNTATNLVLPFEQNTVIQVNLYTVAGMIFSKAMENIAGTAAFVTGQNIWLTKPGHYEFNSFFISQQLQIGLQWANFDLVNGYTVNSTVIVEIEDTYSVP